MCDCLLEKDTTHLIKVYLGIVFSLFVFELIMGNKEDNSVLLMKKNQDLQNKYNALEERNKILREKVNVLEDTSIQTIIANPPPEEEDTKPIIIPITLKKKYEDYKPLFYELLLTYRPYASEKLGKEVNYYVNTTKNGLEIIMCPSTPTENHQMYGLLREFVKGINTPQSAKQLAQQYIEGKQNQKLLPGMPSEIEKEIQNVSIQIAETINNVTYIGAISDEREKYVQEILKYPFFKEEDKALIELFYTILNKKDKEQKKLIEKGLVNAIEAIREKDTEKKGTKEKVQPFITFLTEAVKELGKQTVQKIMSPDLLSYIKTISKIFE